MRRQSLTEVATTYNCRRADGWHMDVSIHTLLGRMWCAKRCCVDDVVFVGAFVVIVRISYVPYVGTCLRIV